MCATSSLLLPLRLGRVEIDQLHLRPAAEPVDPRVDVGALEREAFALHELHDPPAHADRLKESAWPRICCSGPACRWRQELLQLDDRVLGIVEDARGQGGVGAYPP